MKCKNRILFPRELHHLFHRLAKAVTKAAKFLVCAARVSRLSCCRVRDHRISINSAVMQLQSMEKTAYFSGFGSCLVLTPLLYITLLLKSGLIVLIVFEL